MWWPRRSARGTTPGRRCTCSSRGVQEVQAGRDLAPIHRQRRRPAAAVGRGGHARHLLGGGRAASTRSCPATGWPSACRSRKARPSATTSTAPAPPGRSSGRCAESKMATARRCLAARNHVGDIRVKGHPVMHAYENNPEETAKNFRGWFKTGDMGVHGRRRLPRVTGRSKVINRGVKIISPTEIEEALLSHPSIKNLVAFPRAARRYRDRRRLHRHRPAARRPRRAAGARRPVAPPVEVAVCGRLRVRRAEEDIDEEGDARPSRQADGPAVALRRHAELERLFEAEMVAPGAPVRARSRPSASCRVRRGPARLLRETAVLNIGEPPPRRSWSWSWSWSRRAAAPQSTRAKAQPPPASRQSAAASLVGSWSRRLRAAADGVVRRSTQIDLLRDEGSHPPD